MGWRRALLCIGLLGSCERPAVVNATAAPAAAPVVPATPPAAFVVYLRDQRTLVIPTGGGDHSRLLDGLWLPASGSAVRYGPIDEEPQDADAMLLEVCVDAEERCDVSARVLMPFAGGPRVVDEDGDPCPCVYIPGVSEDQPWDYEGEDIEEGEGEDPDDCGVAEVGALVSPPELVAVEGGTVHFEEATYTGGCGAGMPMWAAESLAVEVSPSYSPRPMSAPRPSTCGDAGVHGMDNDGKPESAAKCAAPVEYPVLMSGRRARIAVAYARDNGISICCAAIEPLSPETCPSAIDPCGRIDAGEDEPAGDYWVATDGSYMLVLGAEGLEVTDRRGGARFEVELPEKAAIVGVHFIADASAYLDAVGPTPKWRYLSLENAVEMDALESTADYVTRARELVAADLLDDARSVALAGLGFEHEHAIDAFGTEYDERIALLRLLERIATASDRPDEAAIFRGRAKALRGRADG